MSQIFQGWAAVATNLRKLAESGAIELNHGQKWSLNAIADRIQTNGVVLADEVGIQERGVDEPLLSASSIIQPAVQLSATGSVRPRIVR